MCNMEKFFKFVIVILSFWILSCVVNVNQAYSSHLSQIVIPFKEVKEFNYYLDESKRCLIVSFKNTVSEELPSFTGYDSSLISKILIKEYVASSVDVLIFLKDDSVKTSVYNFNSPFRVVVDTYKDENLEGTIKEEDSDEVSSTLQNYGLLLNGKDEKKRHTSFEKLSKMISKYPDGMRVKGQFPRFIYRFESSDDKRKGFSQLEKLEKSSDLVLDSDIVAQYAMYFYSIGSELKALATLGYLLRVDPKYVNEHSDLIWVVAEAILRGGNPSVASGYYSVLADRSDDKSILSCIRKSDLMYMKGNYSEALNTLESCKSKNLDKFKKNQAQSQYNYLSYYLIRKAYINDQNGVVPLVDTDTYQQLINLPSDYIPEHKLYAQDMDHFLISSLILNYILEQKWTSSNSVFVANYFRNFASNIYEPEYSYLKDKLKNRLQSDLNSSYDNKDYLKVVEIYEGLEKSLKSISKDPKIAWMLAESYRYIGQNDKASVFYEQSSQMSSGKDKFKASYRQLISFVSVNKNKQDSQLDASTYKLWQDLSQKDKNSLAVSMKQEFKSGVLSESRVKTPALISLDLWSSSLETGKGPYTEDSSTSENLSVLASKFESLGLRPEKKKTLALMLKLKTDTIKASDRSDLKEDLINLAEEYRREKEYEKSADSYIKVAGISPDGKASLLYKGSLMYLQAGMVQKAHEYLTECLNYTNEPYYINLCKERLEKLSN